MKTKASTAVLLGLGSNKPYNGLSCTELLDAAVQALALIFAAPPIVSSVYRTAAMYVTCQSDFYNMALIAHTALPPHDVLQAIHQIEACYGRDRAREVRNGPRTLDIDIELYGEEAINDDCLIVPHPRLYERAFVLVPALEVLDTYIANGEDVALSSVNSTSGNTYWSGIRAAMTHALAALSSQRVERA